MRPWGFDSPLSQKPSLDRAHPPSSCTSPQAMLNEDRIRRCQRNAQEPRSGNRSSTVDAEIDRVARDYTKAAHPRLPPGQGAGAGRQAALPGQILHEVVHELVPRAVDDALRERGLEPLDTPDIRDVIVEEGQPLKFTATFETRPASTPAVRLAAAAPAGGDAAGRGRRRNAAGAARAGGAVRGGQARPVERGDTVVVDWCARRAPRQPIPTRTSRSRLAPRPILRGSMTRYRDLGRGDEAVRGALSR